MVRCVGVYLGKMAIAIARWGSRIVNVSALAKFFKASEAGTEAAAAGAFLPLSQFISAVCSPRLLT